MFPGSIFLQCRTKNLLLLLLLRSVWSRTRCGLSDQISDASSVDLRVVHTCTESCPVITDGDNRSEHGPLELQVR